MLLLEEEAEKGERKRDQKRQGVRRKKQGEERNIATKIQGRHNNEGEWRIRREEEERKRARGDRGSGRNSPILYLTCWLVMTCNIQEVL